MALKDLASSAAAVNENVIEAIVKDYVRYDVKAKSLVLTPDASKLTARQKLLVFLTANEGWCYVDDTAHIDPLLPKSLEHPLGIKGGSLRPALSRLQRDNLVRKDGKGYRVVAANLTRVSSEVLD